EAAPVAVIDHDLRRAPGEGAIHRRVDVPDQQLPPFGIRLLIPLHLLVTADAADAFHVGDDVDLHRPPPPSRAARPAARFARLALPPSSKPSEPKVGKGEINYCERGGRDCSDSRLETNGIVNTRPQRL